MGVEGERLAAKTMQSLKPGCTNLEKVVADINKQYLDLKQSTKPEVADDYLHGVSDRLKANPEAVATFLKDREPAKPFIARAEVKQHLSDANKQLPKQAGEQVLWQIASDKYNGLRHGREDFTNMVTEKDLNGYTSRARVAGALLRAFPADDGTKGSQSTDFKLATQLVSGSSEDAVIKKADLPEAINRMQGVIKSFGEPESLDAEPRKRYEACTQQLGALQLLKNDSDSKHPLFPGDKISYDNIQDFAKRMRVTQQDADNALKFANEKAEVTPATTGKKDSVAADNKVDATKTEQAAEKTKTETKHVGHVVENSQPGSDSSNGSKPYEVKHGDCLYSIIRNHSPKGTSEMEIMKRVKDMAKLNHIEANPHLIFPKQKLIIPTY